jgi:hypothetical protein
MARRRGWGDAGAAAQSTDGGRGQSAMVLRVRDVALLGAWGPGPKLGT